MNTNHDTPTTKPFYMMNRHERRKEKRLAILEAREQVRDLRRAAPRLVRAYAKDGSPQKLWVVSSTNRVAGHLDAMPDLDAVREAFPKTPARFFDSVEVRPGFLTLVSVFDGRCTWVTYVKEPLQ